MLSLLEWMTAAVGGQVDLRQERGKDFLNEALPPAATALDNARGVLGTLVCQCFSCLHRSLLASLTSVLSTCTFSRMSKLLTWPDRCLASWTKPGCCEDNPDPQIGPLAAVVPDDPICGVHVCENGGQIRNIRSIQNKAGAIASASVGLGTSGDSQSPVVVRGLASTRLYQPRAHQLLLPLCWWC